MASQARKNIPNDAKAAADAAPKKASSLRKLIPTCKPPVATVLRTLDRRALRALEVRLTEMTECVLHPAFRKRNAEKTLLAPLEVYQHTLHFGSSPDDSGVYLAAQAPRTLTATEEQELFIAYNYVRYRLMKILRTYRGKRLSAKATRDLLYWDNLALIARNVIVEANMGLVPTMVQRSQVKGVDFNDLIGEGQLALLRAVDKFDCARGFKFSTYACRAILTSLSRAMQKMARYRSQFPTEFDPDLQKSDFVQVRREQIEDDHMSELARILDENTADLNPAERRVIRERFGIGKSEDESEQSPDKTLRQVAEQFGVTKERIRQIQNRALNKLRNVMDERVFAA